jgi:hypothetical protein
MTFISLNLNSLNPHSTLIKHGFFEMLKEAFIDPDVEIRKSRFEIVFC